MMMMMFTAARSPTAVCSFGLHLLTLTLLLVAVAQSQSQSQSGIINNATTDPSEVQAINLLFERWGLSNRTNGWNISGEPCSGTALVLSNYVSTSYNPMIYCDCTYNSASTCHITALKVTALDVVSVLPDELWDLIYLTNLKLAQNYLTGPLPASIGKLTRLQELNFAFNALSGEIPPDLGLLTDLRSLALSINNFSGQLPPELGNLRNLDDFYIGSSGVRGEIPSTFANLTRLTLFWAPDNKFTGRIPDFIGNWSLLETLVLQGNSFEGPIPSTFSNLTALTDLRITDVSLGSSSLEFIANLNSPSLSILILRNNNISGPIPSTIGEYQSLAHLDLSFNGLTGQIPSWIFNLSQLSVLFLGNNSLSGTLPAYIGGVLSNIDLSYNGISGALPSWVDEPNLQVNLVANNFTIESSNSRALPSGLKCLQRNFPCNRDFPIYSSFGINCGGGQQITSSNRMLYERDNETLGPSTYYVASNNRWAISNVGLYPTSSDQKYTINSSREITNTFDSELFQTARISAVSLRYYGLGLENGNYTVRLQFAEIIIDNPTTWRSLGRRMFDIYIQGKLLRKDFDIRKEAGGNSYRPVSREFTVQVSESYLEIHLFWAGKGTCCVPYLGAYGPSISAISTTPNFNPSVTSNPPSTKEKVNRTRLIVVIVVLIAIAIFLTALALHCFKQSRPRQDTFGGEEFMGMDTRPYTFGYTELRDATNNFMPENKLGEGGFGSVYKGTLADGRAIAVKQLSAASHHGKCQFVAEIATITAVQHRNLVILYGCCIEADKRLLVYEFMENKSLDQALFGNKKIYLDWPNRFEICLGIARGLAYLHEESRLRIVHRDVKASNILLDSNLNPKISDFGLAKLYDDKKTHMSTRVAGTIGYLAPEYALRGHLTEKVDVFGFGVVALEIVSGRPNSDSTLEDEKIYLLEWAWNLQEGNCEIELVDKSLSEFDEIEVKKVIRVALACTQTSPTSRPSMSHVVAMLSGDADVSSKVASRPGYLADWKPSNATTFTSNIDTVTSSTSYSDHYATEGEGTSSGVNTNRSPKNATIPMLHNIVGLGT